MNDQCDEHQQHLDNGILNQHLRETWKTPICLKERNYQTGRPHSHIDDNKGASEYAHAHNTYPCHYWKDRTDPSPVREHLPRLYWDRLQ